MAKSMNKRNMKKSRAGDAGSESEEQPDPPEGAREPWLGLEESRLAWIALWLPCGTRSVARFGDHQNHRYDAIKADFENIRTRKERRQTQSTSDPSRHASGPGGSNLGGGMAPGGRRGSRGCLH